MFRMIENLFELRAGCSLSDPFESVALELINSFDQYQHFVLIAAHNNEVKLLRLNFRKLETSGKADSRGQLAVMSTSNLM